MPADLEPRRSRITRKNLIKDGFKLPRGFPISYPKIVTRYVTEEASVSPEDLERNDGHDPIPCKIVGKEETRQLIKLKIEHDQVAVTDLIEKLEFGGDEVSEQRERLLREPWDFVFPKFEARAASQYDSLKAPVTVVRLPEIEVPYGINPSRIRIRLPADEMPLQERVDYQASSGMSPDWNCLSLQYMRYKGRKSWCSGDGICAMRLDDRSGERNQIPCGGKIRLDSNTQNPNVCEFRGSWRGGRFVKHKSPCKESFRFRFFVQGVPTLWCYEVHTSSRNSYEALNSTLLEVAERSRMVGRDGQIKGLPMELSVRLRDFSPRTDKGVISTTKPIWHLDIDRAVMKDASPTALAIAAGEMRKQLPPIDDVESPNDDLSEFYPESPTVQGPSWVHIALSDERVSKGMKALNITDGAGAERLVDEFYEGSSIRDDDERLEALLEHMRDLYAGLVTPQAEEPQAPVPEHDTDDGQVEFF